MTLTWRVTSDPDHDLLNREGLVTFDEGQSEAEVIIGVRLDAVPEMEETFLIIITHVTKVNIYFEIRTHIFRPA